MTAQQTERPMFTAKDLRKLILPLVAEQLLATTVGMADTMMVSNVGEAAVSGISIVDTINVLLIQVFAALATGGAVVASQYLGRRDGENACRTAKQLMESTVLISLAVALPVLFFNRGILQFVYGNVEADVMQSAKVYFFLSALSYPMLAVYNTGAALFRCMGNSRVSLAASAAMNVINIAGNALLIFGFHLGVAGAGISTLAARTAAALIVVVLLHNAANPIYLKDTMRFEWHGGIMRSILRVGVPNGIEGGVFQAGKLLVAGLVSTFGTSAIAANAVCNNMAGFEQILGSAVNLSIVTVIGRCVGAQEYDQARRYMKILMKIIYAAMGIMSVIVFAAAPWIVSLYGVSEETAQLALRIININCVTCLLIWPSSFSTPTGLRAAGDARYTMIVSMVSMVIFRIGFSYIFAQFGMGLMGVWMAMYLDWIARMIFYELRMHGSKWEKAHVIDD